MDPPHPPSMIEDEPLPPPPFPSEPSDVFDPPPPPKVVPPPVPSFFEDDSDDESVSMSRDITQGLDLGPSHINSSEVNFFDDDVETIRKPVKPPPIPAGKGTPALKAAIPRSTPKEAPLSELASNSSTPNSSIMGEEFLNAALHSYQKVMFTSFDAVQHQADSGLYAMKRVTAVIKKFCVLQEEFSRGIVKMLEHEEKKIQMDQMSQQSDQWKQVQFQLKLLAAAERNSAELTRKKVVDHLTKVHKDLEERKKNATIEERKCAKDLASLTSKLTRAERALQNHIESIQEGLAEDEEEKPSAVETKTRKVSTVSRRMFDKLKKGAKKKLRGTMEEQRTKAYQLCCIYEQSLIDTNGKMNRYYNSENQAFYREMEDIELMRLRQTHQGLSHLAFYQQKRAHDESKVATKMFDALKGYEPEVDIKRFTTEHARENGMPIAPTAFTYNVTVSPNHIKAGMFTANPRSAFGISVEDCMLLEDQPADLPYPLIMESLIKDIEKWDGLSTQGIFRISVNASQLEDLKTQFADGDYTIKDCDSPHVPACLLKLWLRSLQAPLIPVSLYPDAVAIGRMDDKSLCGPHLESLLEKISTVSFCVIERIAQLSKQIASPANVKATLMTYTNLAVVFAPSCLRNPSEDPMELLANSKYETAFTHYLLEHFPMRS